MKLSSLFTDHAVFQRGIPVPVWGWTAPLVRVKAKLGSFLAESVSGTDGAFTLRLPPMPAGGPYTLEVSDEKSGRVLANDVWVGEVWLASGQSNMEWTLSLIGKSGEDEIAESKKSPLNAVRMISIPRVAHLGPKQDVDAVWMTASEKNLGGFSAVAYYFAKKLHRELGVAVGIVSSSWGGTKIEAWIDRPTLIKNPDMNAWVSSYESELNKPGHWADQPDPLVKHYPPDPGNSGEKQGWASPDLDDKSWEKMNLPQAWQTAGHNHSGVFWFRKTTQIPTGWAGQDLILSIGAVDKHDTTYFNGVQVGATGKDLEEQHWSLKREYKVPGKIVKPGMNVIAVRAYSFVFNGGLIGPDDAMKIHPVGEETPALPLTGSWRYQVEHDFGLVNSHSPQLGPGNPNTPYILFDSMIAPLRPYALAGAIWYQGESNADSAAQYHKLLSDLIGNWRHEWCQGDFPFLVVQLANYLNPSAFQAGSKWAFLREAQLQILSSTPETGLAVAIDIGEALDIHPKNKSDVGLRLAQWALTKTYGRSGIPSGPLYSGMRIEGAGIRLRFAHVGGGLVAKNGDLKTFFIAGLNQKFLPARAVIEGRTIFVSCPEVEEPVAVRYAWADNPAGCNLYNSEGFPASPFRTDTW